MINPAELIRKSKELTPTEKIDLWRQNLSHTMRASDVLKYACSPYITFGVKQFELSEPIDTDDFEHNLLVMFRLLDMLSTRELTGDRAKEAIKKSSAHLNPDQQMVLECILKKDLDCGIGETIANKIVPNLIPSFDVQLANKDYSKVRYPCFVETKRNGKRVIAFVHIDRVDYYSRNGLPVENLHIFDKELIGIAAGNTVVFDGEVSGNTGDHLEDFRISKKIPKLADSSYDATVLNYTVWDFMPIGNWVKHRCPTQLARRKSMLKDAIKAFHAENKETEKFRVAYSKHKTVNSEEELLALFRKKIKLGHEGAIAKDPASEYEFKRSNAWVKLKVEEDADLKIVDVVEGKKSWAEHLGAVVVDFNGVQVHCGVKGFNREQLKQMWAERTALIGKVARVVYMAISTNDKGLPSLLLPKFVEIRDDK
jgi:DNA ligase-1